MELKLLSRAQLVEGSRADVAAARERARLRRLRRLLALLAVVAAWLWWRTITQAPVLPRWVHFGWLGTFGPALLIVVLLGLVLAVPLVGTGRSPHVLYRPGDTGVTLDDVKGSPVLVEEVVKTLNLFLAYRSFREQMGGTPRRAVLFEGPPGTGKTHMAKAMAGEAGVPFLFVSSSAFQSMYYGQTNRRIRAFFRALRRAARAEGGAIGFIEEIDAIGSTRAGMGGRGEGISGVVNELLIQLQSFDSPTAGVRLAGAAIEALNRWLPPGLQLRRRHSSPANVLVIGATNRAADLDPALLRPGRFDRSIYFDLPSRAGRREIIDYYLDRKSHDPGLDDPVRRDALADLTFGYSPVMIEHLLDEALVWALRRGGDQMTWEDLNRAKMTEEIGLPQPVEYTPAERRAIATHEAGHAAVAWLVGKGRRLEVLSIVKRGPALGLLAHTETEERFTRTHSELRALIQIAMGGMAAEEELLGDTTSGVGGDLASATKMAAQMVGSFGMAGSLVSFDAVSLGREANLVAKVLGSDDGRAAVESILEEAKGDARRMVAEHLHIVQALRDALISNDELVGSQITDAIEGAVTAGVVGMP